MKDKVPARCWPGKCCILRLQRNAVNRPISIKGIELITNKLPKQKAPGPERFTGQFYQTFKDEIIPTLYNLLQNKEAEGILPDLVYETSIT